MGILPEYLKSRTFAAKRYSWARGNVFAPNFAITKLKRLGGWNIMVKNQILQYLITELTDDFDVEEIDKDSLLITDGDYEIEINALGACTFQAKVRNTLTGHCSDTIDIDDLGDLPFEATVKCLLYYTFGLCDGLETFA